ncbi:MAG: relaxase/mobilization nuclease domain-containing protein [Lachnospiraceae bacterium]|nr:relaxase/mobilization nuclease domain-containing protein [Lachnospiraceae bacterium]
MAVTRLLRIKETKGSNKALHLKKNLFYICRNDKTENGLWIGGNAGRTPEVIYRTMVENKKFWCKTDGTQAFHYMLSFPPDCGIDEATAFQIAEEFCSELLGDNYYYTFAVHNDRAHMHVHITFDSVSKADGLKFHSPKGDWEKRIQPITDRLCEKYHLPTLDYSEERRGRNYGDWKKMQKMERGEYYSWTDIIRDDIDEAIHNTDSYEAFLEYLRRDGYTVTRDGKYLSLFPEGAGRAFRTGRLGDGYAKEEIIQRIADKARKPDIEYRYQTYGNREEIREIIYAKIVRNPGWRMTPFQRSFWRRWNNTYFIRKPDRMTEERRQRKKQDILEIRKLSDAIRYMMDYDIGDLADLGNRKAALEEERKTISRELSVNQTRYYKKQPFYLVSRCEKLKEKYQSDPLQETKKEIEDLTEKIETVCPYGEAVFQWHSVKNKMDECRRLLKDNKKEQKVVDDIFRLFYQMEPPLKEQEIGRKDSESCEKEFGDVSGILPEQSDGIGIDIRSQKRDGRGKIDDGVAERSGMTKVTINEKLFIRMDGEEDYITRIPFKREYVSIPKAHCQISADGTILTAWLRDDQEYKITDSNGIPSDTLTGAKLKINYEDKTRRKRRDLRNGRNYSRKEQTASGTR